MSKKDKRHNRWSELETWFQTKLPHLGAVLANEEDFIELRIKMRFDGTTLGILKRYDSNGGPVVCFGTGYGVVLCLLALDATVQGGNWRVDKPWKPKKEAT